MSQLSLANGQHASGSAEWWSPPEIVEPARALWPIGLDPASCPEANEVVQALRIFTIADDGLLRPWNAETVWCNPPSVRGEESAWEWWVRGAKEWASWRSRRLLWVVFNPSSVLTIAQEKAFVAGVPTPQQCARVEFRERIRYLKRSPGIGLPGVGRFDTIRGKAPPHGSALLLLTNSAEEMRTFADAYAHLGDALFPARPAQRTGGAR